MDGSNHPLQRRRGIFIGIKPCFTFGGIKRVCCITNSCVQMKPIQLIATNSNYVDWQIDAKNIIRNQQSMQSHFVAWPLDRILRKAWRKHFYNMNGKFFRIQHTFQTWHRRITISSDRCNTHLRTHTSPVIKKSKNVWMNESPRDTSCSTVVRLLCCRRNSKK